MTAGQPRNETRDCRIALFVTPSKLASIKRAAEREGIPRAEYLRRILTWGTALFYAAPDTREKVWALLRDSGSDPSGRKAEGFEGEASQSGLSAAKASPKPPSRPSREG